jgi:hypothetical protein
MGANRLQRGLQTVGNRTDRGQDFDGCSPRKVVTTFRPSFSWYAALVFAPFFRAGGAALAAG